MTSRSAIHPHSAPMQISTKKTTNSRREESEQREDQAQSPIQNVERLDSTIPPSNEYVLNVAFFSFLLFIFVQGIFAVIAKSESMLADCMAMSVDAFTYLFNLIAERLKQRPMSIMSTNSAKSAEEERRKRRLVRLYLEFIPPLLSVGALVIVSIMALKEAILTIMTEIRQPPILREQLSPSQQEDEPDAKLMLIFSTLNLVLDMLNVTCFARAHGIAGGYTGVDENATEQQQDGDVELGGEQQGLLTKALNKAQDYHSMTTSNNSSTIVSTAFSDVSDDDDDDDDDLSTSSNIKDTTTAKTKSSKKQREQRRAIASFQNYIIKNDTNGDSSRTSSMDGCSECCCSIDDDDDISEGTDMDLDQNGKSNLNMCSAYTHVMADTFRSITVLIAAGIACVVPGVSPTVADSTGAVLVSAIIALSLGPLIMGLIQTWNEIQEIREELRFEADHGDMSCQIVT